MKPTPSLIALFVVAIACTLIGTGSRSAAAAPSVTLRVTDLVTTHALPGVSVRMSVGGQPREHGITDGNGTFVGRGVRANETVLIQFELDGYVRQPEQATVVVQADNVAVARTLVKAAPSNEYLLRLPNAIRGEANKPSGDKARVYKNEWDRVTLLPLSAQEAVAGELSVGEAKSYLLDSASFRAVMKPGAF
jgi:hypothetical protein